MLFVVVVVVVVVFFSCFLLLFSKCICESIMHGIPVAIVVSSLVDAN